MPNRVGEKEKKGGEKKEGEKERIAYMSLLILLTVCVNTQACMKILIIAITVLITMLHTTNYNVEVNVCFSTSKMPAGTLLISPP